MTLILADREKKTTLHERTHNLWLLLVYFFSCMVWWRRLVLVYWQLFICAWHHWVALISDRRPSQVHKSPGTIIPLTYISDLSFAVCWSFFKSCFVFQLRAHWTRTLNHCGEKDRPIAALMLSWLFTDELQVMILNFLLKMDWRWLQLGSQLSFNSCSRRH